MIWFALFALIGTAISTPDENLGVVDPTLFEGDMKLTDAQRLAAISGMDVSTAGIGRASINANLWPGAVMPYTIDSSLAYDNRAMEAIRAGMQLWTSSTCVHFEPRTNEAAYARFHRGGGCSSMVGRTGSRQDISLATGCWSPGIVAHEIGHALGFFHEQSRPDRDQYVTIYWNNIISGMSYNFNKYPVSQIDSLGTPYDYNSVMHYGSTAFSSNGRPTIVPKQAGVTIGNRRGPSATDLVQMNKLYKCSGDGTLPPTTAAPPTGTQSPVNQTTVAPPTGTQAPVNQTTAPPTGTQAPVTQTPPPPTQTACVDNHQTCSYWARTGECQRNPNYMLLYCKKSCNVCGKPVPCVDNNRNCAYWAFYGECQRNPKYMSTYCKKSCRVCV